MWLYAFPNNLKIKPMIHCFLSSSWLYLSLQHFSIPTANSTFWHHQHNHQHPSRCSLWLLSSFGTSIVCLTLRAVECFEEYLIFRAWFFSAHRRSLWPSMCKHKLWIIVRHRAIYYYRCALRREYMTNISHCSFLGNISLTSHYCAYSSLFSVLLESFLSFSIFQSCFSVTYGSFKLPYGTMDQYWSKISSHFALSRWLRWSLPTRTTSSTTMFQVSISSFERFAIRSRMMRNNSGSSTWELATSSEEKGICRLRSRSH